MVNRFFGETITVSGLITGRDLIEQLKGKALGERLLIPDSMLRAGNGSSWTTSLWSRWRRPWGCR